MDDTDNQRENFGFNFINGYDIYNGSDVINYHNLSINLYKKETS